MRTRQPITAVILLAVLGWFLSLNVDPRWSGGRCSSATPGLIPAPAPCDSPMSDPAAPRFHLLIAH